MRSLRIRKDSGNDYRRYELSLPDYLRQLFRALLFSGLLAYCFYQSLLFFFLSIPLALLYPFYLRASLRKQRQRKLLLEFREALSVLSSFLGAGYSLENAFRLSGRELNSLLGENAMISREFQKISEGLKQKLPIEDLLFDFSTRSGLDEIRNFAELFSVARKSGGELETIIRRSSELIHDKIGISEEILTLSAARRYEQRIMNLIPFLLLLYMKLSSPDFLRILYETAAGRILMSFCLFLYLLAVRLSERILDIEV